jgi:hypothetical protein
MTHALYNRIDQTEADAVTTTTAVVVDFESPRIDYSVCESAKRNKVTDGRPMQPDKRAAIGLFASWKEQTPGHDYSGEIFVPMQD